MAVNVVLKSVWDDKGIKDAQKAFATLGKGVDTAFRVVAVASAAAAAAFVKLGASSVKEASNLEESINAVNVSFGKAAAGVLKIGETSAKSLGVARSQFNQAAVRFSAFADRVVGQGGDVAGFIGDITKRAADFASVFNIDVSEALQVFQSGLSGEAEPLKRFGINLLDSEVKAYALRTGLIGVGETMTEQEKVQARYGLLMEATSKTAGDFANTSDSLANKQRILQASFTDLQAEIGNALLPAVSDLFSALADELLPVFEDFGKFLNSPEGKKIIEDTATTIKNLFVFIANNIETITKFAIGIAGAITALKLLKTALDIATIAQSLFNASIGVFLGSVALVVAGIALITGALVIGSNAANDLKQQLDKAGEASIKTRGGFVTFSRDANKASKGLDYAINQTRRLGDEAEKTRNKMSGLTPSQAEAFRQDRIASRQTNAIFDIVVPDIVIPTTKKETAAEKARKQREADIKKTRELLDNASKEIATAQANYAQSVASAQQQYSASVIRIERDFANRLADVVKQSQQRLRDAFANVVRVSLSDLFEVEETRSVDNLVSGLTTRLEKSRALLAKAGQLNAEGFSQTFIEQVVSAGVETGNELAQSILDASPETRKQLQDLFDEVEKVTNNGMDQLSEEIYNRAGLATEELKNLYVQTQAEQNEALLELKRSFDAELKASTDALHASLTATRETLASEFSKIKSNVGSLKDEIDALISKIYEMTGVKIDPVIVGAAPDLSDYLIRDSRNTRGNTININVRTDATKSAAETGRQIASVVNKYTGGGGGLNRGIAVV